MPYSRRTTAATALLILVLCGLEATAQESTEQLEQCAEGLTMLSDVPFAERRNHLLDSCAGLMPEACEGVFSDIDGDLTVCWREICTSLHGPSAFLCTNPEEPGLANQRLDLLLTFFEQQYTTPLPGWVRVNLMRAFMGDSAEITQFQLAEVMADIAASDLSSEQRQLVVSAFAIGVVIPLVVVIQTPIEGRAPDLLPVETVDLVDEPGEVLELATLPRILISVSSEGLTLSDMRDSAFFSESGFGLPSLLCAQLSPDESMTFCATPMGESESLLDALPWNELYNRLVAIRAYPAWRDLWELDNLIINVLAAEDTPYEVVIQIMDVARTYRELDYYPTVESFEAAPQRLIDGEPAPLFPSPVMLLPR